MISMATRVLGVGSPIVDLLARVSDEWLRAAIPGEKGGMELIDAHTMAGIVAQLDGELVKAPGGSAGNTAFALARLGINTAFLGKIGDDANGKYYREVFEQLGGSGGCFKVSKEAATARCLSLVTPDSERTMRTDLGAAALFLPQEVTQSDFQSCSHVHVEGYLLFNPDLILAVLTAAKEAGCTISLDLASFEVVHASATSLPHLLRDYVDMVFANEAEAEAFCGSAVPEDGLRALAQLCPVVAVKLGKDGALLSRHGEEVRVAAVPAAKVVDTTGAGDYWAAGFLYGCLQGYDLHTCGELGSLLGAEAVQQMGAFIPDPRWPRILETVRAITAPAS
jgi:sugar/nucleoside kinase (ribokinase family)